MNNKRKILGTVLILTLAMGATMANAQPADPVAPVMAPEPAPMQVEPLPAPTAMEVRAMAQPTPTAMATPQGTVPAASRGKKDSWWKVLTGGLLEILLVFVLALATALGGLLVRWAARKLKIQDQEKIWYANDLYNKAVRFGVDYARQKAHTLRDDPDANGKRIDWATEQAMKAIEEYGLPQKSADWIKAKIEAKIGEQERAPNPVSENKPD